MPKSRLRSVLGVGVDMSGPRAGMKLNLSGSLASEQRGSDEKGGAGTSAVRTRPLGCVHSAVGGGRRVAARIAPLGNDTPRFAHVGACSVRGVPLAKPANWGPIGGVIGVELQRCLTRWSRGPRQKTFPCEFASACRTNGT
jgi:hypothetical protein